MSGLERQTEVSRRTGLARSTIYKGVAEGWFPPPVQLTSSAVAWRTEDVDEFIRTRPLADVKRPGREEENEGAGAVR